MYRVYDEAAVERAEQLSPNRLAAVLPAVAAQIHECGIAERHQRARRHRRVEIRDIEDGMSELLAVLPSVIAHGIHDRLTSMAKACEISSPPAPAPTPEPAPAPDPIPIPMIRLAPSTRMLVLTRSPTPRRPHGAPHGSRSCGGDCRAITMTTAHPECDRRSKWRMNHAHGRVGAAYWEGEFSIERRMT